MLNKQFSPYHFDLGLSHPYSTRSSQLFYPHEIDTIVDDVDMQANNDTLFLPDYVLEEGIRQYYEEQHHKEQQRRRQQQQLQRRKQLEEARRQAIMMQKKKEEQEQMERIALAVMTERKRKQLVHLLAQDQQRKRNELAAAYLLAQQDKDHHHRQQYEQEVEYARRQELARQRKMANHRRAQQQRLEEQNRKDCQQAAITQLMGGSHGHFSPQSLPSSKPLNVANNDHDILHLLLNPGLYQSNDDSTRKLKRDTRPTNKKLMPSFITSSLENNRRTKQMAESPKIHEGNESTQREFCVNGVMKEKMINTPAMTFHNCFNIHNEPKTSMSEAVPQTSLKKSVHSIESKKANKKMKSSILIGDVEDASDDECDEDPIWNNRRPSEGQWMEPVLYDMR